MSTDAPVPDQENAASLSREHVQSQAIDQQAIKAKIAAYESFLTAVEHASTRVLVFSVAAFGCLLAASPIAARWFSVKVARDEYITTSILGAAIAAIAVLALMVLARSGEETAAEAKDKLLDDLEKQRIRAQLRQEITNAIHGDQ